MLDRTKKTKLRCKNYEKTSIRLIKEDGTISSEKFKNEIINFIKNLGFKKAEEVPLKKANCVVRTVIKRYYQKGSDSVLIYQVAEFYTKAQNKWVTGVEEKELDSNGKQIQKTGDREFLKNSIVDFSFECNNYYLKVK